ASPISAGDVGRSSQTPCPWLPLVRYTFNMLVPPIVFIEFLKKGIKKQAYLRCENTPAHLLKIPIQLLTRVQISTEYRKKPNSSPILKYKK
ncbi:MAG: hypothetical protein ACOYBG_09560, partial [Eubacteriales bacterium]